MSGLELVATIAGIAGTGTRLSIMLFEVADTIGSAGKEIKYIGSEMASFGKIVRLVSRSLETGTKDSNSSVVTSAMELLPGLVKQCELVYGETEGLLACLKPLSGKKESSLSLLSKVRWLFYRSRVSVLRGFLDSLKGTLELLISTIDFEMAQQSRDPDAKLIEQLRLERTAFLKVVASQGKALDDALKEAEKAKQEAAKLKTADEKKRKKQEEQQQKDELHLNPPPVYSAPALAISMSQLTYTPPDISHDPQNQVVSLALSLVPRPAEEETVPEPPPPPYFDANAWSSEESKPADEEAQAAEGAQRDTLSTEEQKVAIETDDQSPTDKKPKKPKVRPFGKMYHKFRRTSGEMPGTAGSETISTEEEINAFLGNGYRGENETRRSSSYSYSFVPDPASPRQEPTTGSNSAGPGYRERAKSTASQEKTNSDTPETRRASSYSYSSLPEVASPQAETKQADPASEPDNASYGYQKPSVSEPIEETTDDNSYDVLRTPKPGKYVAIYPFDSTEVGHLYLSLGDIIVDAVAVGGGDWWEGSLGDRRGPRGGFWRDCVISLDKAGEHVEKWWDTVIKEKEVRFCADAEGRWWCRPGWVDKDEQGSR